MKSKFWRIYLVYVVAILALLAALHFYVKGIMVRYENQDPVKYVGELLQNASEKDGSLGEFLEKRQQLQSLMQSENPDPGALKRLSDEMDEAQERLQMMDDIVALTEARNEFNDLIGQVNQVLQFIVTGNMEPPSGCTGSCASCSGCH